MPEQPKRHVDLAIRLRTRWCCLMHDEPMWPIRESYRCRICGCTYPVPWAAGRPIPESGAYPTKHTRKRSQAMRELIVMPAAFGRKVRAIAVGLILFLFSNWTTLASEGELQKTDDAYIRADVTPLSAKAAGIVAPVEVSDYRAVKAAQPLVTPRDEYVRAPLPNRPNTQHIEEP